MRTSLIEIQQIEELILGATPGGDRLCLEARQLIDPAFADRIAWQEKTYQVIQEYGRRQVQAEIKALDNKLFNHSTYQGFQARILSIFKRI